MIAPPIASLETGVPVGRSIDQIRQLVERFGASAFGLEYDPATSRPIAVMFRIRDPHLADDPVFLPVRLQAPADRVTALLLARRRQAVTPALRERIRQQAERVAWRNLHDFVRASLIGVQTGIMSLGEAFMASLLVTHPTTGETRRLGELAGEGGLLQSTPGGRLLLGRGDR